MPERSEDLPRPASSDAGTAEGPCRARPPALWAVPEVSLAACAPRISASVLEVADADAFGPGTATAGSASSRGRRRVPRSTFCPETGDVRFA